MAKLYVVIKQSFINRLNRRLKNLIDEGFSMDEAFIIVDKEIHLFKKDML